MNLDLFRLFESSDTIYPIEGIVNVKELNKIVIYDGFEIVEPIKYKGEIYKTLDELYIDLKINYIYKTYCAKCLIDVTRDITTLLSGKLEDYEKAYEEGLEQEEDIKIIDDDAIYYKNGELNLEETVTMEVASSLPMKTVCKNECKGLCMLCGIDLNKETCDCDTDFIDPRLEKLKDFVVED